MSGANTYTGTTTLAAGILNAGVADVPGTSGPFGNGGMITFAGGTLQYSTSNNSDYSSRIGNSSTTGPIAIDTNGQTVTFNSSLASSNSGGLTLNDSNGAPGSLTLTASEAYTGATSVISGALNVTGTGTFGNTAITVSGGTLNLQAPAAVNQNTLAINSNGILTENVANAISGSAGLMVTTDGSVALSQANNYTGNTTVSSGTLVLGSLSAAQSSTVSVGVANGLAFASYANTGAFTMGGLAGSGSFTLLDTANNAIALTVGGNGATTTYSGALSDSGLGGGARQDRRRPVDAFRQQHLRWRHDDQRRHAAIGQRRQHGLDRQHQQPGR